MAEQMNSQMAIWRRATVFIFLAFGWLLRIQGGVLHGNYMRQRAALPHASDCVFGCFLT
ncbi:MAG: hypothetical protein M5R42_11410 [Rhodocyclaceae bacterium]|nr:hypothetical protein [Rhodocyclaceae bacterium]